MRSSSFFIILIFLLAKIVQLASGFALAHILGSALGSTILIDVLLLMVGMVLVGYVLKKFLPKVLPFLGFAFVFFLVATAWINYSLGMVFLGGFFLFLLIGSEAQVMRSLNRFKNIPQWVPFLLTLVPVLISYQLPQMQTATPILFYIVSSVFALVASYSGDDFNDWRNPPPIWLGFGFVAFSGVLYYVATHDSMEAMSLYVLTFVLLFYTGGAAVVYMALDGYLRRLNNVVHSA